MFHMTGKYKALTDRGGATANRDNDENVPLNAKKTLSNKSKNGGYQLSHVLEDSRVAIQNGQQGVSTKQMTMQGSYPNSSIRSQIVHPTTACPTSSNPDNASSSGVFRDNGFSRNVQNNKIHMNNETMTALRTARSRDSAAGSNIPPPLDGDPTISETFDEEDEEHVEEENNANTVVMMDVLNQCKSLKEENVSLTKKLLQAEQTIRQMAAKLQLEQQQRPQEAGQNRQETIQVKSMPMETTKSTPSTKRRQVPFQVSSSPFKAMQMPGLTTASFDTFDSISTNELQVMAGSEIPHFQVLRKQESWGMYHQDSNTNQHGQQQETGGGSPFVVRSIRPSSNDSVSTLSRTGTFDTADMSLESTVYLGGGINTTRNNTTNRGGITVLQPTISGSSSYHTASSLCGKNVPPSPQRCLPQAALKDDRSATMSGQPSIRYNDSKSSLSGHPGAKNKVPCLVDSNSSTHGSIGNNSKLSNKLKKQEKKQQGRSYSITGSSKTSINGEPSSVGKENANVEHQRTNDKVAANGGTMIKRKSLKSIFKGKSSKTSAKNSVASSSGTNFSSTSVRDDSTEVAGNTIEHNLSRSYDECDSLAEF